MPDVGINLTMQEQVSAVAPGVAGALRNIAAMGEELRDSLDLSDLEEDYRRFSERMERVYDIQRANQQRLRGETQAARQLQPLQQAMAAAPVRMAQASGGVAQRLGRGEVVEAGADVMGTVQGILGKAGWIGKVAAGFTAIAIAGNLVSRQYEKHASEIMEINNLLGRFGQTSKEVSEKFGQTMSEITEVAGKYGYTLEQGISLYKEMLDISGGALSRSQAQDVLRYARVGGFDVGTLARYRAMGARFGEQAPLGLAYRAMREAGMERGMFNEFLRSSVSIFEDALSRGVVKGFKEIGLTQAWLAQFGKEFQGQYGLQRYRQLEQGIVGAAALGRETDVLLYNAAREVLRKRGKPTDIESVFIELERGMTTELWKEYYPRVRERTGGVGVDISLLLQETFGMPASVARALRTGMARVQDIFPAGAWIPGGAEGEAALLGTPEMRLLRLQADMMGLIRRFGKGALGLKAGLLTGTMQPALDWINRQIQKRWTRAEDEAAGKEWLQWAEGAGLGRKLIGLGLEAPGIGVNPAVFYAGVIEAAMESQSKYPEEVIEAAEKFGYAVTSIPERIFSKFGKTADLKRIYQEALATRQQIGGEYVEPKGKFTPYDLPMVLERLVAAIEKWNERAAEDQKIDITNVVGEE